jgi:lysozyme
MRTASNKIRKFIQSFETCALVAYCKKPDRPTIGWGATYYENGQPVRMGDRITQKRADELFNYHIKKFENGVNSLLRTPVNQNQFDALVSFAYNLGLDIDSDTIAEGLGDSTLLKYVNANPANPAIKNEFLKWVSRGTIFEKGLTRRRRAESEIYFLNVYTDNNGNIITDEI